MSRLTIEVLSQLGEDPGLCKLLAFDGQDVLEASPSVSLLACRA
jgi:hypothetical protein